MTFPKPGRPSSPATLPSVARPLPVDERSEPSSVVPRDSSSAVYRALWGALSVAATFPFLATRFPPLYDYYLWLFQGHIVKSLLFGSPGDALTRSLYTLTWTPVPNMAAPVGIAFFDTFLPTETAGRAFLILCVLLFAYSFGYLVRSVQRQPTVMEFLGFPFAFGYFMYKGYDSYLFSLGMAFLAIGKLHRIVSYPSEQARALSSGQQLENAGGPMPPRLRYLALLSLLGVVTYLAHLLGWAELALAVGIYAIWLAQHGMRARGALLLSTLAPSLALLAWYVLSGGSGTFVSLYDTLGTKALSLVRPLLLFVRTDPFVPLVPVMWPNLVGLVALTAVVLANLLRPIRSFSIASRTLLLVAACLVALVVLIPISQLGEAINPDERFTLPALLVALASVRARPFSALRGSLFACMILLVIGAHTVEYGMASAASTQIQAAVMKEISPGEPTLALTLFESGIRKACEPETLAFSIGTPTLKWFDLARLLKTGGLRVNLLETSLVRSMYDYRQSPDLVVQVIDLDEVQAPEALKSTALVSTYPTVQVYGCSEDIATMQKALAPQYAAVTQGEGFSILRKAGP